MSKKRVMLIILDGWGHGKVKTSSAIDNANIPFVRSLYHQYPNAELVTFGKEVGLPEGQMGNSEVGHLNIGAGRVVFQELQRINHAIDTQTYYHQPMLQQMINTCLEQGKPLHLIGLLSDGGIHSHIGHLEATIQFAAQKGVQQIYVHAFMDGRDTDPQAGVNYLARLMKFCEHYPAKIASLCGRYFAMDRDKRWDRVKLAYDLLVHGQGFKTTDLLSALRHSYDQGETDEFVKPIIHAQHFKQIEAGEVVFCFNFRTDRCREITQVLTQEDFPEHGMTALQLSYYTMTNYSEKFKDIHVIFDKDNLTLTLGEVLAANNKTQIRIAETEKYPHVTFFFSGGREQPFHDEVRIMVPSPKVATYDMQPEMSAYEVKDKIVTEIKKQSADFICLNFANADMVGHTGVLAAAIKAVEAVDACVAEIVTQGLKSGYSFVIIADHGNADYMINEDGSPNTAHTVNPVPVIIIDDEVKSVKNGKLADIAPTILKMLHLSKPDVMTGDYLF